MSLLDDDNSDEPDVAEFPDRQGWIRVGIIAASILLVALFLPLLGYTVVMTLQLGTILYFVSKRKLWISVVVAAGAAFASRLVFEVWLGTALPHGQPGLPRKDWGCDSWDLTSSSVASPLS